jgi:tetratricopeptide (TPR) repeat protein
MADRYTYIPLIGIFIAITWGATRSVGGSPTRPLAHSPTRPLTSAALAVIVVLAVCTWIQTGYWKSTMTLFDHALRATGESAYAYANVGFAYADIKDHATAAKYMKKSLDLDPSLPYTHYDYANVLYNLKREEEAVREYREALRLKPELVQAHRDLAIALYETGRYAEAWNEVHQCRECGVEMLPEFVRALSQEMPDPKRE